MLGTARETTTYGTAPLTGVNVTVDGKIKSRYTANEIMKQSGIKKRF